MTMNADEIMQMATFVVAEHKNGREDAKRSITLPAEHPFGKALEDGTPYLSTSQVQQALRCGASWDFSYKQRRPRRATEESLFGNICHGVMDVANSATMAKKPIDKRDFGAVAEQAIILAYKDPAIVATVRNPKDLANFRFAAGQAQHCVVNTLTWLSAHGYHPIMAEERIVGKHEVAGLPFALLSYPDAYCLFSNGRFAVLDTKFPGKRVWENRYPDAYWGKTCEARRGYIYATGSYADTLIGEGKPVDDVVVLHASREDNTQVCADVKPVTKQMRAWTRIVTQSAALRIQSRVLTPDPLTADGLCKQKWCDHHEVCPAAAGFLEATS